MAESEVEVSIGLVGEVKSGRTSFINALMREKLVEPGKITTETNGYIHPTINSIVLWDLPGLGSERYPTVDDLQLEDRFDGFLLFTNAKDVPSAACQHLAKLFESKEKPFLLIRTFFDGEVHNDQAIKKEKFNEEETKKNIRGNICRSLAIKEDSIFLISNVKPEEWDFPSLRKELLGGFLTRVKSQAEKSPSKPQMNLKSAWNSLKIVWDEWIGCKDPFRNYFNKGVETEKRVIEKSGLKASLDLMEKSLDRYKEVVINLAIIGRSGVGKSSFINAIRGIESGDKLAAEVGVVETTKKVTSYEYKNNPNIKLFDCPGFGTDQFAKDIDTYFEKIRAVENKFKAFIIFECDRFNDPSVTLAKNLQLIQKPFFFVRAKIDQDIQNRKYVQKKDFNEEETLKTIRDECSGKLENVRQSDIFLINNHDSKAYDFPKLNMAIRDQLPSRERACFLYSMVNLSQQILDEKIKSLKDSVKYVSFFQSMLVRFFTWKSLWEKNNYRVITKQIKFYRDQLGFPDFCSKEFSEMPSSRQEEMKRFYLTPKPTAENVKSFLQKFSPEKTDKKETSKFPTDTESYGFVSAALNGLLDQMGTLAKKILDDTAAKSEAQCSGIH